MHVGTALADPYVPLSALDGVLPFAADHRPLWTGLGTLAVDGLLAVLVTSLLRRRLRGPAWRRVHVLAYAAWPLAVLHGLGSGSDSRTPVVQVLTAGCLAVVLVAAGSQLVRRTTPVRLGLLALLLAVTGPRPAGPSRAPSPPAGRRAPAVARDAGAAAAGRCAGAASRTGSLAVHGPARQPEDLLQQVADAGLRGRGGGGFPLVRKLQAALDARGRPVVVVNAAEGEPASRKDRTLLEADPHLVLDGAQAAARLLDGPRGRRRVARGRGRRASRPGRAAGRVATRLVGLREGYVRSETSAVVSAATGGPGLPVARDRPLALGGPGRRPWLVANAETLAGLALLARHGLEQHCEVGTPDEPGTLLLTVRGGASRSSRCRSGPGSALPSTTPAVRSSRRRPSSSAGTPAAGCHRPPTCRCRTPGCALRQALSGPGSSCCSRPRPAGSR